MTYSSGNNEIIARIQQREQEQSQVIAMSESLAPVTKRNELNEIVNNVLKTTLGFSTLVVCTEDKSQKGYNIQYHNNPADYTKYKSAVYTEDNPVFTSVLNSPEAIVLPKSEIGKISEIPTFIKEAFQGPVTNIVACTIPSKYFKGIVFLGFTRGTAPEKNILRLIKMLSVQFGITLTNILLSEKIIPVSEVFDNESISHAVTASVDDMGLIGNSEAMQKVRSLIKLVSDSDSGVLILGESGTGKELVAKALHDNSGRSGKQLIKVNCAAIPKNLLESELFGHEKGSFTGAIAQKKGKFEYAHNGTLFLDEVGEMPLELQVKLLRVLQEKEIQRIGSNIHITVNTRIIAATNRDLQEEVKNGNFRADLYYRLNVFPIHVPPLKDRPDDIPDLANFFIQRYAVKNNKPQKNITTKALKALKLYNWPGNVRELEHALERAFLLSPDKTIKEILVGNPKETVPSHPAIKPWFEFEKEYILTVLKFCEGKISGPNGAAALLQMPPTTLQSKMERLDIKKRHYLSDK